MQKFIIETICDGIENTSSLRELQQFGDDFLKTDFRSTIYHYTSPSSFQNIIEKKALWFTRVDCLNDYSEGQYILYIFNRAMNILLGREQFSRKNIAQHEFIRNFDIDRLFKSVKELQTFSRKDNPKLSLSSKYETYVCCFSKNRDSLPMWNYYLKGNNYEGFNIGFNGWQGNEDNFLRRYCTVVYSLNQQLELIEKVFSKACTFLTEENYTDKIYISSIYDAIAKYIFYFQFMFKKDCFSHEEEVRIIINVPTSVKCQPDKAKAKYRVKGNMIVPYIEMSFEDTPNVVKGVTVGPCLFDEDILLANTKEFLNANNIETTNVFTSEIPVRY